jgi:hypothetical protein
MLYATGIGYPFPAQGSPSAASDGSTMNLARTLRAIALGGVLLAVAGTIGFHHFAFRFDTWIGVDVSAPAGMEVPGDFVERVFYQDAQLVARARRGESLGLALLLGGAAVAIAAVVGGTVARRRAAGSVPPG